MYNDIVTTIGRGNGAMLVLFDLYSVFDTIDHDYVLCILEKYIGIHGNDLNPILSDFANIICDVPQGSVLGPLKVCYLLPLSSILKYHKIGYHIYAKDIQFYISFK